MAVCDECGNETFSQIAGNVMICDVCGAESLAFTQDVIDTEEGFFATQPSQKVKKIRKKKVVSNLPPSSHATFVEGFQAILQSQVITLITKFGCPLEIKDLVWAMWSQLLLKLDKYHQSEILRETPELRNISAGLLPKIDLTYGLCYLALAMLREPLPLHIFCRHLKQGKIPYITAFSELPQATDQRNRLRPQSPLDLYLCESTINSLRTFLFGREFLLPPLDFHGTLRIILHELLLPELYELCVALWELDQSPAVQPLPGTGSSNNVGTYRGASHQIAMYIFIAFQLCYDLGREGYFEEGRLLKRKKREDEGGPQFLERLGSFEEWAVNFMKSEPYLASGPKPWGTEQLLKRITVEKSEEATQQFYDLIMAFAYPQAVSKKHLVKGLKRMTELSGRLAKELKEGKTKTPSSTPHSSKQPPFSLSPDSVPSSSQNSLPSHSDSSTSSSSSSSTSSSRKRKREKFPFESVLLYEIRSLDDAYHPRMNLALRLFSQYIGCIAPTTFYVHSNACLCRILHRLNHEDTKGKAQLRTLRDTWKKGMKKKTEVEWRVRLNSMAHRRENVEEEEFEEE